MTDTIPPKNSRWRFNGTPGKGELHIVIFADEETVTTVSASHACECPTEDFKKLFSPI